MNTTMKNNIPPQISVVIPCYNGELFIREALTSLINQTFTNWEAIVADNGSTDSSKDIIEEFQEKDNRFRYIYIEKKGVSAARNYGVKHTNGELVLFLDADDWLSTNALEEAVAFMENHPTYKMFNLRSVWVNQQTKKIIDGFTYSDFRHCLIYGQDPKCVIWKSDFLNIGGFDEEMRKGYEDWDFFIRLLDIDSKVKISDTILYYYRINKCGNSVLETAIANKEEVMKYIFKKNYDKYVSLLGAPQLIYQYQERRLPRITKGILHYSQRVIDFVSRFVHL